MQVRYHSIRGKPVRTADGRLVGRVTDLVAEPEGDELRVTALLVGPGGHIRRMGLRHRRLLPQVRPQRIPWRAVEQVGEEVTLRIEHDQLDRLRREARAADEGAHPADEKP